MVYGVDCVGVMHGVAEYDDVGVFVGVFVGVVVFDVDVLDGVDDLGDVDVLDV